MVWVIILTIVGILVTVYFLLTIRLKNKLKNFVDQATKRGYKAKLIPGSIFEYYIFKYSSQDQFSLKVYKEQLSKYDIVVGSVFTKLGITVGKPQLIKDFCSQMSKVEMSPFISQIYKLMNGGGILFTDGDIWKRKRRIISSVFHFDFLNSIIPMVESQIDKSFRKIDMQIREGKKQFHLRQKFNKILSNVVTKAFFGIDIDEYQIEGMPYCEYFIHFLDDLGLFVGAWEHKFFGMKCYEYKLTKKCRQIRRKFELLQSIAKEVTEKQIQKIKNNEEKNKTILTAFVQNNLLTFEDKQNEAQYTLFELIGQFFIFLIGGTDTTSYTLNLALHYLSDRPELVNKIISQTQDANKLELQSSQMLKKLKTCEAVFNQTLRMNGPVAYLLPRQTVKDITLGNGLIVPKGSCITPSSLMCHYREDNYQNPHEFMPERWLEDKKIEPYTFVPFSGGERNCIGQYLARIQSKLLLSKICQKYEFKALNPIKMRLKFMYATQGETFELKLKEQK